MSTLDILKSIKFAVGRYDEYVGDGTEADGQRFKPWGVDAVVITKEYAESFHHA